MPTAPLPLSRLLAAIPFGRDGNVRRLAGVAGQRRDALGPLLRQFRQLRLVAKSRYGLRGHAFIDLRTILPGALTTLHLARWLLVRPPRAPPAAAPATPPPPPLLVAVGRRSFGAFGQCALARVIVFLAVAIVLRRVGQRHDRRLFRPRGRGGRLRVFAAFALGELV